MKTPIEPSEPSSAPQNAPIGQKKLPLKHKVEAILFATGSRISVADITRLARSREDAVKEALFELKQKYENPEHSLTLTEDGNFWKLGVRDNYMSVVKKIVTETELSKTVLETLAVIAFKYPIKQSDLIHIRTNKAYDHLKELEQLGFISRKKHGRTNLIKLSEKFFQYFDLPEEKLKGHLADFESIAKAIGQKEVQLHERKAQRVKELEEMKSQDEDIQKAIDTLDDHVPNRDAGQSEDKESVLISPIQQEPQLETYGTKEETLEGQKVEVGIYDVPPMEAAKESKPLKDKHPEWNLPNPLQSMQQKNEDTNAQKQQDSLQKEQPGAPSNSNEIPSDEFVAQESMKEEVLSETSFKGEGIMPTLAQEKEIEDKVEALLHPPKEAADELDITKEGDRLEEDLDRARKKRRQKDD